MSAGRSKFILYALAVVTVVCVAYSYQYRYFARMVPIPLSWIELIYAGGREAPAPRMMLKGDIDFPNHALSTMAGLKAALYHIRNMSPLSANGKTDYSANGKTDYEGVTFASWKAGLSQKSMFCTDATMLFMIWTHQQGLPAREWWLWASDGYEGGMAHSMVEFYNPALRQWLLEDALSTTIVRETATGKPVSMIEMLRHRRGNTWPGLTFDQDPRIRLRNVTGLTTPAFARNNVTPVLNLKPSSFAAFTPKLDLLIGVPVLVGNGRHNVHVFTTKIAMAVGAVTGLAWLILLLRLRRARRATTNAVP